MMRHRPPPTDYDLAFEAVSRDDASELLRLLERGLSPDASDQSGAPLTFFAVEGRVRCLRLLLDRGADPSLATPDGTTCAMRAARTCPRCLDILLEDARCWLHRDRAGNNILHHGAMGASPHATLSMGRACIGAPGELFAQRNDKGFAPLDASCLHDNASACSQLLLRSNPALRNPLTGRDPLAFCLEFGKPQCARILWNRANLWAHAPDGNTLFAWAHKAAASRPDLFAWALPLLALAERESIEKSTGQAAFADGRPRSL